MMDMSKNLYPSESFEFAQRKKDHIELTHQSKTVVSTVDDRFNYEPLFFQHPSENEIWSTDFLGFNFNFPVWVSSMTGGTASAKTINENLAKLCGEFRLGMGLGSCRAILDSKERLPDFAVRKFLGNQPLFANIGIAQLAELLKSQNLQKLEEVIKAVEADGLIIHINPLQEWFQPGGDRFDSSPLVTLQRSLDKISYPVLVKEVGQGFGPKSLRALLELPIAGIEFGAYGGTNFTLLESLRGSESSVYRAPFINVGHTAAEMVEMINALPQRQKEFIISGGMSSPLDGFELKNKLKASSVIGMASAFLTPAQTSYEVLKSHFLIMKESLLVARNLLELKDRP